MELALRGGEPIRKRPWPRWPQSDADTERSVLDALRSDRWAISGVYNGRKSYERRFSEAFAAFNGCKYCVPVANGSSALAAAIEALGVGSGDEVLVPGLTWVACASSVASVGAVPVLVDIDPDTLCMSVDAAREAISPRTKLIMVVHLYCAVADLDGFLALSEETGVPILEDCSQAHGATWRGRRVGTFGRVGTFSMQQTKVLTSGEGGAAITDDRGVYNLMQQVRADGRMYTKEEPAVGHMELEEAGDIQGRNMCLSEFQAAILLDRLGHLDKENQKRERNARVLSTILAEFGNIRPLFRHPQVDLLTHYCYCLRLDLELFGEAKIEQISRALTAELGVLAEPVDMPLNANALYNPIRSPRTPTDLTTRRALDPTRFPLPEAQRARETCLRLPHRVLLGDGEDLRDIAASFGKLIAHRDSLPR
jgi:dTDP-4-amino-4,6-dideoxygalactose transaminase